MSQYIMWCAGTMGSSHLELSNYSATGHVITSYLVEEHVIYVYILNKKTFIKMVTRYRFAFHFHGLLFLLCLLLPN